jgi:hypothetical protein
LTATHVLACQIINALIIIRGIGRSTYGQHSRNDLEISCIHRIKVLHARNEDVDFDDVLKRRAARFKNVLKVRERLYLSAPSVIINGIEELVPGDSRYAQ